MSKQSKWASWQQLQAQASEQPKVSTKKELKEEPVVQTKEDVLLSTDPVVLTSDDVEPTAKPLTKITKAKK